MYKCTHNQTNFSSKTTCRDLQSPKMMTRVLIFLLAALPLVQAWTVGLPRSFFHLSTTLLRLTSSPDEEGDQNPCWENLYDDDCTMSNAYAASFVASQWIKSMPCASGVEVSDVARNGSRMVIHPMLAHAFSPCFCKRIVICQST